VPAGSTVRAVEEAAVGASIGTVGIIGCGRLGEAVLSGLLDAGVVAAVDVHVSVRRDAHAAVLATRHGVHASIDGVAAARCDIVVLGLKPQVLPQVLPGLAGSVRSDAVVVSLAGGVTTASLDAILTTGPAIIRVMTNTPALVRAATTVVAAGPRADEVAVARVVQMMETLGVVRVLPESSINAVTAVSGSGPAYVFLLAEAMAEAGVLVGLSRSDAVALVAGTIAGAGALLAADDSSAAALREQVTSPGGTTAAALQVLEQRGVRAAVLDAVTAAVARAAELG
jgi:pyrroline-5-carboxylate reductase